MEGTWNTMDHRKTNNYSIEQEPGGNLTNTPVDTTNNQLNKTTLC